MLAAKAERWKLPLQQLHLEQSSTSSLEAPVLLEFLQEDLMAEDLALIQELDLVGAPQIFELAELLWQIVLSLPAVAEERIGTVMKTVHLEDIQQVVPGQQTHAIIHQLAVAALRHKVASEVSATIRLDQGPDFPVHWDKVGMVAPVLAQVLEEAAAITEVAGPAQALVEAVRVFPLHQEPSIQMISNSATAWL